MNGLLDTGHWMLVIGWQDLASRVCVLMFIIGARGGQFQVVRLEIFGRRAEKRRGRGRVWSPGGTVEAGGLAPGLKNRGLMEEWRGDGRLRRGGGCRRRWEWPIFGD